MHDTLTAPALLGPRASRYLRQAWKSALVVSVAATGLWVAVHGVAGVAWVDVSASLRSVSAAQLIWLAIIWVAGLCVYSVVLATSLPGLGSRRGLLLNLTGSAVANVLPLGGAVATALNWRMVRRWGHSNSAFVGYCVTTNVLDVLSKLVLPLVAVAVLVTVSAHVPGVLWLMAGVCATAVLLLLLVNAVVLRTAPSPTGTGRAALVWRSVVDAVDRVRGLLVDGWARLLSGSIGYIATQVALLYVSLHSVGLAPAVSTVLMAAAIERLGTLVPITPGGTGIAEIGTIAWLVAAGLPPVQVVAGVVLYRVFLFALEIPVGAVLLGGWAWWRHVAKRRAGMGAPA